jgi:hypothetical protein
VDGTPGAAASEPDQASDDSADDLWGPPTGLRPDAVPRQDTDRTSLQLDDVRISSVGPPPGGAPEAAESLELRYGTIEPRYGDEASAPAGAGEDTHSDARRWLIPAGVAAAIVAAVLAGVALGTSGTTSSTRKSAGGSPAQEQSPANSGVSASGTPTGQGSTGGNGLPTSAGSSGSATQAAPTIATQPQDRTCVAGGSASVTVSATGSQPLQIQWQQSTDGGVTWTPIAGATAPSWSQDCPKVRTLFQATISNSFGTTKSNSAAVVPSSAG